jgi:MFS family permease
VDPGVGIARPEAGGPDSSGTHRRAPASVTRLIVFDGICTTAMNAFLIGPFLAAFALALGASHREIGLISAIAFLSRPMQLAGLYAVDRWNRRRGLIVSCALSARLLWILIVCLPFLPEKGSVRLLLAVLVCSGLIAAIPGPAWHSLVRNLLPVDSLGTIFSKRLAWGTVVGLTLTLAGGFFVDAWPDLTGRPRVQAYSLLFLVGIVFGLVGVRSIMRLPEPPMEGERSESLRALIRLPLRDQGFRPLLGFIAFWNFAINLATPFFVVFMLERLLLPMRAITAFIVLQQLTSVLSVRIWGLLSDRFSNKAVLLTTVPLAIAAVTAWSFTTLPKQYVLTIPLLIAIQVGIGLSLSAIPLAITNLALKQSPPGLTHAYMMVADLFGAPSGAIAPLVGGWLMDFFAAHHLALTFQWSGPAAQLSAYVVSIRGLDFIFVISGLAGVIAFQWLALIPESGTAGNLLWQFKEELSLPFRRSPATASLRENDPLGV